MGFLRSPQNLKKSLSYFWQERSVLCPQCQKVNKDFSRQMWSSRFIQTLIRTGLPYDNILLKMCFMFAESLLVCGVIFTLSVDLVFPIASRQWTCSYNCLAQTQTFVGWSNTFNCRQEAGRFFYQGLAFLNLDFLLEFFFSNMVKEDLKVNVSG